MEEQTPVKISLKSKKVYVGIVYREQFEQLNFDNLAIIPMISSYRDKDTPIVTFDCNYSEVYKKHQIIDKLKDFSELEKICLSDFLISIRSAEIKTISFFNIDMFDEFNQIEPTNEIEGSNPQMLPESN